MRAITPSGTTAGPMAGTRYHGWVRAILTASTLALALTLTPALLRTAHADELAPPPPEQPEANLAPPPADPMSRIDAADVAALIERAAMGTVRAVRGSTVFGPTADVYLGGDLTHGETSGGVALGLAVYTYESPSPLDLRAQVTAAIKAKLKERLEAMVAAGEAPPTDLDTLVQEIAADVIRRIASLEAPVGPPTFGFLFELGAGFFGSEPRGLMARLVLAKGVKRVLVGLSLASKFADLYDAWFEPGLEIVLPIIPSGGGRTPVLAGYVRGDLALGNDGTSFLVTAGARGTLDLL